MAHMTRVVAHDDQCANLFRKPKQTLPYIGIFIFPSEKSKDLEPRSHTIYMDFSGLLLPCTP